MQFFINERSLHGQYNAGNIKNSMQTFLLVLKTINESVFNKKIYISQTIFTSSSALNGEMLQRTLNDQRDWRITFTENMKGMKKWEPERIHSNSSSYIHNGAEYEATSVAEHSERKASAAMNGLLINFVQSSFGNAINITVTKDTTLDINVDCAYDEDSVINWLTAQGLINPTAAYNLNSHFSPRDSQTVLNNPAVFQFINRYNQGRKIYSRVGTNELWVVDNKHNGSGAHMEVFDRTTEKHLGTSAYNQINLLTKYKKPNRKITP